MHLGSLSCVMESPLVGAVNAVVFTQAAAVVVKGVNFCPNSVSDDTWFLKQVKESVTLPK